MSVRGDRIVSLAERREARKPWEPGPVQMLNREEDERVREDRIANWIVGTAMVVLALLFAAVQQGWLR